MIEKAGMQDSGVEWIGAVPLGWRVDRLKDIANKEKTGAVGRCGWSPRNPKFAGALMGQRARKGVFITTSSFTKEARDYVSVIESKIILIDGGATF